MMNVRFQWSYVHKDGYDEETYNCTLTANISLASS